RPLVGGESVDQGVVHGGLLPVGVPGLFAPRRCPDWSADRIRCTRFGVMSLDALRSRLDTAAVLTDPDIMETYRQDWARAPHPGTPLAVCGRGRRRTSGRSCAGPRSTASRWSRAAPAPDCRAVRRPWTAASCSVPS